MHHLVLLILGLVLVIGVLIYYIVSTRPGGGASSDDETGSCRKRKSPNKDLKREDNVIFLPSDKNETGESSEPPNDDV